MAKLSPVQAEFLKQLFGPALGDLKKAAELAKIDDFQHILTDDLVEAIKTRADTEIALNVPKAVFRINQMLNEPETVPFIEKLHKVCTDVLDRSGLSKAERPNASGATIGLVYLPSKKPLPEPPSEDDNGGLQTPSIP